MERLKTLKEQFLSVIEGQMGNLDCVDAEELGEVVDIVKDLEEAIYYCSIVKAMEESKEEKKDNEKYDEIATSLLARTGGAQGNQQYYTQPYYPMWQDTRYIDDPYLRKNGARVQYYGGDSGQGGNSGMNGSGMSSNNGASAYSDGYYSRADQNPVMMRDPREGRSGMTRRGYMENKENHVDKKTQMQELEKYMTELSSDITEMIRDASPEERTILQTKLQNLAAKVTNV